MPTDSGWIKIHRKILKSAVWEDPLVFRVWMFLLLSANYERRQLLDGSWLERGQLKIGLSKCAKEIGTSVKRLRNALEKLEKCGNLGIKGASTGTTLTICKYSTYQDYENEKGKQRASDGQARGKQRASDGQQNKKERREEGKKEEGRNNKDKGHFVPPSIEDVRILCEAKGYTFDPEVFVAYYGSQGWKKANGQNVTDWKRCCVTFQRQQGTNKPKQRTFEQIRQDNSKKVLNDYLESKNGESDDNSENTASILRELEARAITDANSPF